MLSCVVVENSCCRARTTKGHAGAVVGYDVTLQETFAARLGYVLGVVSHTEFPQSAAEDLFDQLRVRDNQIRTYRLLAIDDGPNVYVVYSAALIGLRVGWRQKCCG